MSKAGVSKFDDVRRSKRIPSWAAAELTVYPDAQGKPAYSFVLTQDVSKGGCRIIHPVQLVPGQRVEISLDGEASKPAVVAWCISAALSRIPKASVWERAKVACVPGRLLALSGWLTHPATGYHRGFFMRWASSSRA
jgi:hypothetical protein